MKQRLVDFLNNEQDLQALVLGKLGFSTLFITQKTKLTAGQVLYRLRKQGIRRADYRDGRASDVQTLVFVSILPVISRHTRDQLAVQSNGKAKRHG